VNPSLALVTGFLGVLLTTYVFVWLATRTSSSKYRPSATPSTPATPYRTAADRPAENYNEVQIVFKNLVAERRRFELRIRDISRNSIHVGMCNNAHDEYYCCRGRRAIKRVLDLWDSNQKPTMQELAVAESFMEDK